MTELHLTTDDGMNLSRVDLGDLDVDALVARGRRLQSEALAQAFSGLVSRLSAALSRLADWARVTAPVRLLRTPGSSACQNL